MRLIAALILVLLPLRAWGDEWKFVEVDLSLRPDGKATVVYKVAIEPQGSTLHGFYFQGYTGQPHFDRAQCYALDPDGARIGLDIRDLGDKYDIILAGGRAVTRGRVIYVFTYGTDLAATGNLAKTTSPELGELAVLNWSPVQWKSRLGHYTVKIYWPATVGGAQVTHDDLARVKLRTEKFMNDSYKMDYFGTELNGKHWLTQRIHWQDTPPLGHLRVQEYVDAALFGQLAARQPGPSTQPAREQPARQPVQPGRSQPPPPQSRGWGDEVSLIVIAGFLAVVFLVVIAAKHRSMLAAADGLKDVSWLEADWSPPQIVLSSFRKTGKIPELEPIEAAVLMGIPFNRILTIMLGVMQSKGAVRLHEDGVIDVLDASPARLGEYERSLLDCLALDGKLNQDKLRQWVQRLVDAVQKKSWDADLESTQNHYSEKFASVLNIVSPEEPGKAQPQRPPTPSVMQDDYYYPYYFYWEHSHPQAVPVQAVPPVFTAQTLAEAVGPADDYKEFMANPACYEGCFVHSACHDACHSACHDACHSACHDACHSACHDACHSACVSGDSH